MTQETKQRLISDAVIIGLTGLMAGASELLSEREIIFPEIAALAVGALAAPKRSWRTTRLRCIFYIALCAVLGLCVSVFVPLPVWAKVPLTFAVCQLLLIYSGTTFAPMISAAVLPVLMCTESVVYPVSAVVMTALIMLAELILTKADIRPKESFVPLPKPQKRELIDLLVRCAAASAIAAAAIIGGVRFLAAPPLLVAFTEFSNRSCPARSKPVKTVLVIGLCGLAGALCRGAVCLLPAVPLTAAAMLAAGLALLVMRTSGLFLPPAGALAILPMIIPRDALMLYPVQVLAGASLFMTAALCLFRKEKATE